MVNGRRHGKYDRLKRKQISANIHIYFSGNPAIAHELSYRLYGRLQYCSNFLSILMYTSTNLLYYQPSLVTAYHSTSIRVSVNENHRNTHRQETFFCYTVWSLNILLLLTMSTAKLLFLLSVKSSLLGVTFLVSWLTLLQPIIIKQWTENWTEYSYLKCQRNYTSYQTQNIIT